MPTKSMQKNISREWGFTLIELVVTMIVAAIVIAVGVPNFRTFLQNNRIASQTNTFISAMTLARSEALKRSANVTICASGDQATCGTDWSAGWIVFQDDTVTGAPADPAADELIRVWGPVEGGMTLTAGADYIRFLPTGLTDQTTSATFTLDIPDCTGNQQRSISLSLTGNVSVTHVACTP